MKLFPAMLLHSWWDTKETLHRFCQIVGKVRLAASVRRNHWWHAPFHLTGRGITTQPMGRSDGRPVFAIDFVDHQLRIHTPDGRGGVVPLQGQSVASIHDNVMAALDRFGVEVAISIPRPFDLPDADRRFADDTTRAGYDPAFYAHTAPEPPGLAAEPLRPAAAWPAGTSSGWPPRAGSPTPPFAGTGTDLDPSARPHFRMWLINDRRLRWSAWPGVGEDELLPLDDHLAEPRLAATWTPGASRHRVLSDGAIGPCSVWLGGQDRGGWRVMGLPTRRGRQPAHRVLDPDTGQIAGTPDATDLSPYLLRSWNWTEPARTNHLAL
jgi:Family of unknown function (DUF5996)